MNTWMIRAGEKAGYIDTFIEQGLVAIGWTALGNLPATATRDKIDTLVKQHYPDKKRGWQAISVSQLYRFLVEIAVGDTVITYDPGRRVYHVGSIASAPEYKPDDPQPRQRHVQWTHEVQRDTLSQATKNTLGAISTLFLLSDASATEIQAIISGKTPPQSSDNTSPGQDATEDTLDSMRSLSRELIKDKINALDWMEFQELVAGVLRAMGYKTRVSSPGADRGVDILASPDGFGFEQPKIIVECKHRPKQSMGAPEIRSFLGGRHKDEKGLYVSTGGFTKEARYEAERASTPTTLMDLEQLVDAVMEQYPSMDNDVRTLLPLVTLYWPVG